jgi:hypothetical protein
VYSVRKQVIDDTELTKGETVAADHDFCTSSVVTWKLINRALPNDVVIAQSVASRPVATNTRPMRRALCLASNVHHRFPR